MWLSNERIQIEFSVHFKFSSEPVKASNALLALSRQNSRYPVAVLSQKKFNRDGSPLFGMAYCMKCKQVKAPSTIQGAVEATAVF